MFIVFRIFHSIKFFSSLVCVVVRVCLMARFKYSFISWRLRMTRPLVSYCYAFTWHSLKFISSEFEPLSLMIFANDKEGKLTKLTLIVTYIDVAVLMKNHFKSNRFIRLFESPHILFRTRPFPGDVVYDKCNTQTGKAHSIIVFF